MVDPEVLKAIEIIDKKIQSLLEARNRLAMAFGVELSAPLSHPTPSLAESKQPAAPLRPPGSLVPPPQSGRKVQLAEFLLEHGPLTRLEIVDKAGLPEGTVSYCLNDKRFFEQDENGNWKITDYSRHGLERKSQTGIFQSDQRANITKKEATADNEPAMTP